MNSEPVRSLEWLAYGFGQTVTPARTANEKISVIAIDDASLKALGDWPWNRDQLAAMVRYLRKTGVRAIGIMAEGLDKPQNELGLALLQEFRAQNPQSGSADALITRISQQLNTDQVLARELDGARNVYVAVPFTPVRHQPENAPPLSPLLEQQAIKDVQGSLPRFYSRLPGWAQPLQYIHADHLRMPIPAIARNVDGLGLSPGPPVVDGSTAARPVVVPYGNQYLPGFSLLMAAAYSGVQSKKIQLVYDSGIKLGDKLSVPTDNSFRALPFYYHSKKESAAFQTSSFHEVLNGDVHPGAFAGKIVLMGPTSPRLVEYLATPIGEKMPPVMIEAHTLSSILNGDFYTTPRWALWVRLGVFLIIGIYLMYFLPRLGLGSGLAVTGLLLIAMLNAHLIMMAFLAMWLPLAAPAAALLTGHFLMAGKQLLLKRVSESQSELAKTNRLLAQAYHSQGQLDMAFEKYRLCAVDEELLSMTYNLGLDYERKRQFNKAVNVFRYIRVHKPNYRDTKDRVYKNLKTSNEVVLGNSRDGLEKTLLLTKGGVQKPMLGRYQIESELGKGAMGTVYLGTDPKIGRTVAIKTMPLSSEFENEMLEEVKQRFFREAETAGRLSHNNIVTIYDVGEEHDLAYIAMDFLQGTDMSKFAKKDKLLEVGELFNVITQVADALNYAHEQNVVHRDIKPANIIYDRRAKKPTVTDFGVAHITDNTKTKTGTILGTPSFMSPEQLSGTSVDGRSDLFALGVTFFQLLTGELPFVAESISSLMYKITNEQPRDILQIRPDLPICIKAIISKSLQKDPEKRYQTGAEFIKAMRRCEKNINSK